MRFQARLGRRGMQRPRKSSLPAYKVGAIPLFRGLQVVQVVEAQAMAAHGPDIVPVSCSSDLYLQYTDTITGAPCTTSNDCSDDLVCTASKCASANACNWAGHCTGKSSPKPLFSNIGLTPVLGAPCKTSNDCDGVLVCTTGGKCGMATK